MNIQIKVSEPIANMNQRESQCVKRAANMLRANGYSVDIKWDTPTRVRRKEVKLTVKRAS
jgi:hypothetical protein